MDPAESQEPRVSSALVVDQMQIMREVHGADVVARACAALPAPLAEELAALTTAGFCSLDLARELKNGVAAAVGMDPLAFQRDICARGVDRTLHTVWRFFLRRLGDHGLSQRIPVLYSRSFNRGRMTLLSWREGHAELDLQGWPQMPEYDLVGLMSGGEKLLQIAGRARAKITATRRPPVILIHATWQR